MCILKYQKSKWEAQFGEVKHAFNTTHSDSERKSLLFCWLAKTSKSMKMHCNFHLRWIMKSAMLQHCSNWASKWHLKNINKTIAILLICSKRSENGIDAILYFVKDFVKYCQMASEGSRGAPRGPAGGFRWSGQASKSVSMNTKSCEIYWIPLNSMDFVAFHRILWISLHSIGFYGFHCIP